MNDDPEHAVSDTPPSRKSVAACFLLTVVALPLIGALLWGRSRRDAPTASAPNHLYFTSHRPALANFHLDRMERNALLEIFWRNLRSRKPLDTEKRTPDDPIPKTLTIPTRFTVFVTLYAAGRDSIRRHSRKTSLAGTVRSLAQEIRESKTYTDRGFPGTEHPRVRIDIVTQSIPLSIRRRHQLSRLVSGRPWGIAMWKKQRTAVFLPTEFAEKRALTYRDSLEAPAQEMNLAPAVWKEKDTRISLLRSYSFVSARSNPRKGLELVRGLPFRRQITRNKVNSSCRMLARYIRRMQNSQGRYHEYRNASTHMSAPTARPPAQARATLRLIQHTARTEPDEKGKWRTAFRRSLAGLLQSVKTVPDTPSIAFVGPQKGTQAPSLPATAWVLRAFCAYNRLTSDPTWNGLIQRLSRFLLLSQNEAGAFVPVSASKEDTNEDRKEKSAQFDHYRQSICASALATSYGVTQDPAVLRGAQKGVERMRSHMRESDPLSIPEHHQFIGSVFTLSHHLPATRYHALVRKSIRRILNDQLLESDVSSPDLIGASLQHYPPNTHDTARTLASCAAAWRILKQGSGGDESFLRERIRRAARLASRFLLQFQFTRENSYYVLIPAQTYGGIRQQPGSNLATVNDAEMALRAMDLYVGSRHLVKAPNDTESKNH